MINTQWHHHERIFSFFLAIHHACRDTHKKKKRVSSCDDSLCNGGIESSLAKREPQVSWVFLSQHNIRKMYKVHLLILCWHYSQLYNNGKKPEMGTTKDFGAWTSFVTRHTTRLFITTPVCFGFKVFFPAIFKKSKALISCPHISASLYYNSGASLCNSLRWKWINYLKKKKPHR